MNDLTAGQGTLRPMLRLALPVLAEELLNLLVGYTDWWLTGHYLRETEFKAAIGLMAYAMWLIPCMFAALAIGATALTARFTGAGDRKLAAHATNQAMTIGVLVALLATALTFAGGRQFIAVMQLRGPAAEYAWQYLTIVAPVIPLLMIQEVATACLRGAGDAVSGSAAKVVVNVLNVVISAGLVTGYGPFPNLGWRGLAIGTAIGHAVGGLILLALLFRGRAGLQIGLAGMRPDGAMIWRLLRIGLPGGADILSVVTCHLVYSAIINRLGVEATAAHGLGVQIEALSYLPGSAFQAAAASMAGQYLGAGDPRRATRSVLVACLVGHLFMNSAGLTFIFASERLTTFFTGDPHDPTGQLAAGLLKVVAISCPFLCTQMILTGALRGAGDTVWPLAISFIGLVGVRLPGACLLAWEQIPLPFTDHVLPGFGLGVFGAWYAMVTDVGLRSLIVAWRFFHGGWKYVRV